MDFLKIALAKKREIQEISLDFEAIFLVVFGSQISKATHKESDLDMAVLLKEKANPVCFFNLVGRLQKVFETENLHLNLLNDATLLFKHKIVNEGKLLFGNPQKFLEYKLLIHKIFLTDMFKLTHYYDKILTNKQNDLGEKIYDRSGTY